MLDWLARAQQEQDRANRTMIDGVLLRMGQGAAMRLAEIIDVLNGKAAKGVVADSRQARRPQSDQLG